MSLKRWEKKVLETSGAEERVHEIEDELRLAAHPARVVELADTQDSNPCAAMRAGSTPASGTTYTHNPESRTDETAVG